MSSPPTPPAERWALRSWQSDALAAWHLAGRRGVVRVATGGGKTRFALACVASINAEISRVHIVVPTLALVDQWYVALQDDLSVSSSDIAVLSSSAGPRDLRTFNIAVINSARAANPEIWDARRLLIVDECHRAASPQNTKALRGAASAALGLSATPERQYDDFFQEAVQPALGPIIYEYSIQEATADGILAPFRLTNVRVPLTEDEQHEYERLTKRLQFVDSAESDDSEGQRSRILIQRARVANNALIRIPVSVKLLDQHRGQRSLVFHESIDSAERLASLLKRRNHSVALYHSRIGESLRRENLRLFRRGVYDVLVTCRALDEGINIPEVRVAVIAAASATDRQRVQRLGRVLRPAEGKRFAQVYTIYATDPEENRLKLEAGTLAGTAEVGWMRMESTS